uniref:Latent-transforming growth factor beta-binding protein 1 n=1 Tax=Scleropages formosus TaxID=113540 RepID=A0A8C9U827_SCLFO
MMMMMMMERRRCIFVLAAFALLAARACDGQRDSHSADDDGQEGAAARALWDRERAPAAAGGGGRRRGHGAGDTKDAGVSGEDAHGTAHGHAGTPRSNPRSKPTAAAPSDEPPAAAAAGAPPRDATRAAPKPQQQQQQQRFRIGARQTQSPGAGAGASASSRQSAAASRRLTGPNVCGGQHCCSGWAVAPGTNRCIKPDCQPPCQNRGSCSRPHMCVCRSGFQGARCEEVAPEQVYVRAGNSRMLRPLQPSRTPQQPRRQASDSPATGPQAAATRQPLSAATQVRRGSVDTSPQQTGTSRTVKRYPSSGGPITTNALPNGNGASYSHRRPTTSSEAVGNLNNAVGPTGANLTTNLDRIKIVFTPMVCRRVCTGGRCHNSCEKGETTTVYSENQSHSQPPRSQGFRLFFCQIPCMNGGRCIGRDHCWCPSNSTGKFCHLPAAPPNRKPPANRKEASQAGQNSSLHSMYTLPLSNQQASLHPSLVNVHIQHPPEAEVQVHQVARVKQGQVPPTEGNGGMDGTHSVQQRSQPSNGHGSDNGNAIFASNRNGHSNGHVRLHTRLNGYVGRCFQETIDGQCGKPLPGLTKQDDCCGSVGASWGLSKCTQCPPQPAYAVIANGHVECPKGYKRMNVTHCQDINECLMPGICKNAECLNTRGSYRCTCKAGYMLDPARSHCVSDKAISEARGMCYRSTSAGICSLPLSQHITKQICCCSRVGKAWGPACERCPLPDTDHFKEICPAGHGYTYSRSDIQITLRQVEEEEFRGTAPSRQPHPQPDYSSLDVHHPAQVPIWENEDVEILRPPAVVTESPSRYPVDVVEKTSPYSPINLRPEMEGQDTAPINVATQVTDVDRCSVTPSICGPGVCVSLQAGYTCYCNPGYKLSPLQTRCVDINECESGPCEGKGRCVNSIGSYACQCYTGYSQVITQNKKFCQDVNECDMPNKCPGSRCVNTVGSYTCECDHGYALSSRGQCEDVNECQDEDVCTHGRCANTEGSYRCICNQGFQPSTDNRSCQDVDECLRQETCLHGMCVNLEGSYRCICNLGYQVSFDSKACQDIDECAAQNTCPNGICKNTVGSYSCSCRPGFTWSADGLGCQDVDECEQADACPNGLCSNSAGSFSCKPCSPGFTVSQDGQRCQDINECLGDVCSNGICLNSEGSYSCVPCPTGYRVSADGELCKDIDECTMPNLCPTGNCVNTAGSYTCVSCKAGYRFSEGSLECEDVDECSLANVCPGRLCKNTVGSYICKSCGPGYELSEDGYGCEDLDECSEGNVCSHGQCLNTDGSFQCLCETGFKFSLDTGHCEDMDECKEYGSSVCGTWRCENTLGSYRCFMGCQPGFYDQENGDCDIDECANKTVCGDHGFCKNTDGSYLCHCDLGYTNSPGAPVCVDVNECEMSPAPCGDALCENVEGSFLCVCTSDSEEFDPHTNQCRGRVLMTEPPELSSEEERKECYYNLNDEKFCSNVLSRNTTKQECCCTVGAGWGDNCEIHPCPLVERAEYNQLCPYGTGLIPIAPLAHGFSHQTFKDADECEMFGPEICKNGRCSNSYSAFSCFCRVGYYYDAARLGCVDHNECLEQDSCVDGMCINSDGSFNCFCNPPLVLDGTRRRCVSINDTEVNPDPYEEIHIDICWESLTDDNTCSRPLLGRSTTYAECCCLFGLAWSNHCALCPSKTSEDYAMLCNLPRSGSDSLRERPGYEYDPEDTGPPLYFGGFGPTGGENYYNGPGSPEYGPRESQGGSSFIRQNAHHDYTSHEVMRVPVHRPREFQLRLVEPYSERHDEFEGLRAEECGILNGCENGRCVRVREGYTCDCFDGYHLDMTKMACADINECDDISDKVPLCKNGVCTNTEGSYKCTCLPGFVTTAKPHECIPEEREFTRREAGK